MKQALLAFLIGFLLMAVLLHKSRAQVGITFFPGPGMPATAGGGPVLCSPQMNGTLDLSNTCNNIYVLTGII